MATRRRPHAKPGPPRLGAALLVALAGWCLSSGAGPRFDAAPDGTDLRIKPSRRPTVEIAFPRESYRAGDRAALTFFSRARGVSIGIFRAGTERRRIVRRDQMLGTPVTAPVRIGMVRPGQRFVLRVGKWVSGLYFVRATARGNRVGHAPFVLRPRRLGEHRVAVVLPTFTWQAYNFRDDDHDGDEDTWYADPTERFARLGRPHLNRGVPQHYKYYDQPFLRWLIATGRTADYLADTDIHRSNGRELARAYDLVVFPGHHEYVTSRAYDAITGYRDRGGSLVFLSANNFFWRVDLRRDAIWRIARWRDLGRPEAALVGVQYIDWDDGSNRGPWIVRGPGSRSWIFRGVSLRAGSRFSSGGIEIDRTVRSSPRGTKVLAEIPNVFGPGKTAQMTYYETRRGARVFAAGAFTLAGAIWEPPVRRLVSNLWNTLGHREEP